MIATVRDIARGGFGVVPGEKGAVLVPGVITGETIRYRITHRRHGVQWGTASEILEPSPHRVTPPCPHYNDCGGCNLQHLHPRYQRRVKAQILRGNMRRIAGMDSLPEPQWIESPDTAYRTRVIMQVSHGRPGFFARGSRRLVPVDTCLLMPEAMGERLRGIIREGVLGDRDGARLILLSNGDAAAAAITAGQRWHRLSGPETVTFHLPAGRFRVGPRNFVQANRFTMAAMQAFARPRSKGIVSATDLYAGAGFFTLPMGRACPGQGTALEADRHNLHALKANLQDNGIDNITAVERRVESWRRQHEDFLLVDPPRSGLPPALLQSVAAAPPREMVYFSCDSATFSRDLAALLAGGLTLVELQLVENFPHSDHLEIAARLQAGRGNQGLRKSGQKTK